MDESALSTERRHEIDALRVLVLLLLIVYHAMLSFHPVAPWLLLPQNGQLLDWIHGPMALVNVWRIPLLFVISGMAIWFSLTHLSVREVLIHRLRRIAGPWILGWFVLGPLCFYMGALFFAQPAYYAPNPHYLWFLNNILVYMVLLTPLAAYVVGNSGQSLRRGLATGWRRGYIPLVALLLFAGEAGIINPKFYTLYFTGPHGWLLGFLCFALGICCAAGGSDFRHFVGRFRYVSLAFACALYMGRVSYYEMENAPNVLVGMEGLLSIGAILGLATIHLNKTTPFFQYARAAVFPVYILHYPIQFILSYALFPLGLAPTLKLILLISGVLLLSVAVYELVLRRVPILGTIFGLARKE